MASTINMNKIFPKGFTHALIQFNQINEHKKNNSVSKVVKKILQENNITSKEQFKTWGGYKRLYPMVEIDACYHWKFLQCPESSVRNNTQLYLRGYKQFKGSVDMNYYLGDTEDGI